MLDYGGRTFRRLLVVIGVACLVGLVPVLSGLVGALMLYVIMRPVYRRASRVLPRRVSAFATTIGVFVLLLLPAAWVITRIVAEATEATRTLRPEELFDWLSRTPLASLDLVNMANNVAASALTWLSTRAFSLFGSVSATALNVFIALFGLYYLLIGEPALWDRAKRLLPVPPSVSESLAARFGEVTEALLLGTMLTAILQGAIVGGSFALVGLPAPLLWGFVTACVSVLPLFGSALVWLPGSAVLFTHGRPIAAAIVLAIGAGAASNLDNVVRLFVFRRVSGIHPMVTLVGAFAGVRMFGVIGAFLGPLILSYFFELLAVYEQATQPRDDNPVPSGAAARLTLQRS